MMAQKDSVISTDLLAINDLVVKISKQTKLHEEEKNRRADRRYSVHARVQLGQYSPDTGEFAKQAEGWARNISHTGMLLVVEEIMEPGNTLAIDLGELDAPGHFVIVRVVRCVQILPCTFEIGVCFLEN